MFRAFAVVGVEVRMEFGVKRGQAFFQCSKFIAGGEFGFLQQFLETAAQVVFGLLEFLFAVGDDAFGEVLGVLGGNFALFDVFVEEDFDFFLGDNSRADAGEHGFFDEVDHGDNGVDGFKATIRGVE